jgi:hypothetical protein
VVFEKVTKFYHAFQGSKCVIGYSYQDRPIYAMHTGSPYGAQFISVYAIHAREWITSYLALEHLKRGLGRGGGWVIPLANPDGVILCERGKPLWKANARGVDLNCNFDADWGMGRYNTTEKGAANCIGDCPFSEPETRALRTFTFKIAPKVTLSWHTKGEEIYWSYEGKGNVRGAEILAEATGYQPKVIYGSVGGYKDWCIQKLGIPAYTIECGSDNLRHPLTKLKQIKSSIGALDYFCRHYFAEPPDLI